MEHSPSWEVNCSSVSQEIPSILWNSKFHNRVHKTPSLVPILSQINPVHAPFYLMKSHFLIILPSMRRTSKCLFPSVLPHQNFYATNLFPRTYHIPRPSHSYRFDHTKNISWGVKIMKLVITQFPPVPFHLVPFWLPPHSSILHSTLFSNILSSRFSLCLGHKILHQY
jgi:hypothetical protein